MIRAAVIGLGVIGKLHAELAQINGELVAVCDIDESRLTPYSQAKQYTSYARMLSEIEVDVVHICTPKGVSKRGNHLRGRYVEILYKTVLWLWTRCFRC